MKKAFLILIMVSSFSLSAAEEPDSEGMTWERERAGSFLLCDEDTDVKRAAEKVNAQGTQQAEKVEQAFREKARGIQVIDPKSKRFIRPRAYFELSNTTVTFVPPQGNLVPKFAVCAVANFTSEIPHFEPRVK